MMRDSFPNKIMSGITVSRRDGFLIAVKRADPDGAARLRHEADLLARLDHPGLVQFVAFIDGDPAELHMRYAGTGSWQNAPPSTERGIVEGLAAVAATIADLHEVGRSHGSLRAEHVVVAADHRPVLCGLGTSAEADADTCGDDLLGLAGLIAHLAGGAPDGLRRLLDTLASRVSAGELSARALTDELNRIDTTRPHRRVRPRLPSPTATGAAVGLLGLLLVGGWLLARGDDRLAAAGSAGAISAFPPTAPTSASMPSITTTTASTTVPARSTPDPAAPEMLVVEHEGRRFGLGRADDIAVIGDWDCDGIATPALLQSDTGLVSVYASWPGPGAELAPESTQIVANATDLEVDRLGDCDRLRVIQPSGSTLFTPELP